MYKVDIIVHIPIFLIFNLRENYLGKKYAYIFQREGKLTYIKIYYFLKKKKKDSSSPTGSIFSTHIQRVTPYTERNTHAVCTCLRIKTPRKILNIATQKTLEQWLQRVTKKSIRFSLVSIRYTRWFSPNSTFRCLVADKNHGKAKRKWDVICSVGRLNKLRNLCLKVTWLKRRIERWHISSPKNLLKWHFVTAWNSTWLNLKQ